METERCTPSIEPRSGGAAGGDGSAASGRRRRAFTLFEALIASVVLAIAVVGVAAALVCAQQQSSFQQDDTAAVSLAAQLMEEVAARPVMLANGTTGVLGWPAKTDRSKYDTVGDYNGYTETVTEATASASAIPNAAVVTMGLPPPLAAGQYRRKVVVSRPTSIFGASVTQGDFAVINVSVESGASGRVATVSRVAAATRLAR